MNFWISFWTIFFFIAIVVFTALAVAVTIGGFFNIRSLFRNLTSPTAQEDASLPEKGKK